MRLNGLGFRSLARRWRSCSRVLLFRERFFARIEIGLPLLKLLLLLGLMFGRQSLLDLALNFGVLFRFRFLFLTGNKSNERNDGCGCKKFLHGDC